MVLIECRDLHLAVVEDRAFADLVSLDRCAGAWMFLQQIAAVVNVIGEEREDRIGQAPRAARTVQLERV